MTEDTFLRWAREEDNRPVSAGSLEGVFEGKMNLWLRLLFWQVNFGFQSFLYSPRKNGQ